ncbi:OX-2 membrane glycoprotein [Phaethornis superciliosus]
MLVWRAACGTVLSLLGRGIPPTSPLPIHPGGRKSRREAESPAAGLCPEVHPGREMWGHPAALPRRCSDRLSFPAAFPHREGPHGARVTQPLLSKTWGTPEVGKDEECRVGAGAGRQKREKVLKAGKVFQKIAEGLNVLICKATIEFLAALLPVVPQAKQRNVKVGDSVTLGCVLTEPKDVLQVTWQKDAETSVKNIATYSTAKGLRIHKPYQDRMNLTSLVLNETSITFWDTRMDDSGCYTCIFNTFPSGSISGHTCLNVFGLNASVHYNSSGDNLVAICSAVGLPEPTITWNNLFNSTPTQEMVRHTNGLVSITSKLEINTQSISVQNLICRVNNTNEKMELPMKIKGDEGSSLLWLTIPGGILIVIVVLTTPCWRKRICRRC